jgi:acyl-[acyl-carrier-protein]-phospholipid O-acyltransferase/long-chain-fatty-acid--[acyl-carrier-protein] ligase
VAKLNSDPTTPARPASTRRGFWALIVTQFQGAFSDNALKTLVTFIGLSVAVTTREREAVVPMLGILFSLPFILFSMAGGHLADRFSKRTITIAVKLFEIAVMVFAFAGLWQRNLPLAMAAVCLMGIHSAFFGPSKYGLLPELLPEKRLSWGNGILELGTFTAIIFGGAAGGLLFETFKGRHQYAALLLLVLAGVGLACSFGITRVPAANPTKQFRVNFLGELWRQVRHIRRDRVLWLALLGNIYFSFVGALVLQNAILFGTDTLAVGELRTSYLQVALAIGVGLGSFAAGHLSRGKIEYGLVPFGAVGLTVFCAALWSPGLTYPGALINLGLLGFFGGFFIVPVSAILQHRPHRGEKGAVLATSNLLSFVGIAVASAVFWLLITVAGCTTRQVFLISGAMTLGATVYVVILLPDSLLRLMLWMLTNTIYRIRVEGRDNIPEKGGALFVCNHVSFVDALLLFASTDRPIRGIVFKDIYENPLVKPFAKIMRAIPISAQQRPRDMLKSLQTASDAIRNGEVVCIFAEGQITRIGQLLPFRRGMQYIMRDVDAPIIPVNLDGVWGSIFSFERGRFFGKLPHRIPYPVTVSFGKPMPPTATAFDVREAVQQLQSDAWPYRKTLMQPLQRALIQIGRRQPFRFAMGDQRIPKMTYGAALMRSVFLARRLRPLIAGQEMVGVLLPPSVGGALTNYALMLMARVPVNLNYTVTDEIMASCARQCDLKTVITSRAFLEKVKLTVPANAIYLEDLIQSPRRSEKLMALWMSFLLPARMLERNIGRERRLQLDDLATIIFSSGSTGEPKGVMLTHYNIASNIEQAGQMFAFKTSDRILGILPFFHSFGFTVTLVLPPVLGPGVVFHPNPLDARAIGELVQKYRVTFLLTTPTFLQMYLRTVEPEQFGSLQYVVTGAEKLPERLAQAFEDRFGIRPLEGYGCTECSPVVAVNTHEFRAAGFRQVGAKRGKIGHPVPGVSVKIEAPETFAPVPLGQPGMLLVKGPNIMKGYLGQPDKTAAVIRDGWYVTGDIAALDEEGFLQITDRASRFSKIGGEMVPHIKVEEKLHELAGATEHTFSVTGVPDEKKGERLVVLHTLSDDKLQPVLEQLAASDLPNLWKPRPDNFYRIEKFPLLGTGKLDLRQVRTIAEAEEA